MAAVQEQGNLMPGETELLETTGHAPGGADLDAVAEAEEIDDMRVRSVMVMGSEGERRSAAACRSAGASSSPLILA